MRRLVAGAVDRAAIGNVVLQGRAEPATELLPPWISGYAPPFAAPAIARATRATAARLPADQRTLTLRIDPADAIARPVADRIAVDIREAGGTVTVQIPAALARRPDVRLGR